ncbi:hypothetical protein E2C01_069289 [Portunus trituberculatus]|uniref:Uncharacterized protein n=1 Tax=Portunus trituberculatus TaxID=210409 RepID=A0A5B7HYY0_PORTR|nr:hypothetical protein [Portunus trituberculatus]
MLRATATKHPRHRQPLNTSHYENCRKNVGKYYIRSELKVVSPTASSPLLRVITELSTPGCNQDIAPPLSHTPATTNLHKLRHESKGLAGQHAGKKHPAECQGGVVLP